MHRKHSIVFVWLVSYMTILIIPVIISAFSYYNINKIVEDEIHTTNSAILKQMQYSMDNIINDVKNLGTDIVLSDAVKKMTVVVPTFSNDYNYKLYDLYKSLQSYDTSHRLIDDFYLYLETTDTSISTTFISSGEAVYSIKHSDEEFTYGMWTEAVSAENTNRFIRVPGIDFTGKPFNAIIYVQKIPGSSDNLVKGVAVIIVDAERLRYQVESLIESTGGTFLIIDDDDYIIYSSNENYDFTKYSYADFDENIHVTSIKDEKLMISHIKSDMHNLKYVYILPDSVFWQKITNINQFNIFSLLVVFLVGGMFIYYALKKNYNPVQKLMETITLKAGVSRPGRVSEYRFIENVMHSTIDEMEKIKRNLQQKNDILRENLLAKLLLGDVEYNSVSMDELLERVDITLVSNYFSVVLFYIDDVNELFHADDDLDEAERFILLKLIIQNVSEDIIGQNGRCFFTNIGQIVACVVNVDTLNENKEGSHENPVERAAKEVADFVEKNFEIDINVVVSKTHETLFGISKAYQETMQVLEYTLISGNEDIISTRQVELSTGDRFYYPFNKEQQLINAIKAGDYQSGKVVFDEVFENNFVKFLLPANMAKCLMFDVTSTIIKTLNEIGSLTNDNEILQVEAVDKLLEKSSPAEMRELLDDILKNTCEKIKLINERSKHNIKDKVISFVNANFSDQNLSIVMIEEHFSMTGPYISQIFKEQSGESIVEYVNRFRVEKAIEILKAKDVGLEKLATATGYSNSRTFSRNFKKYVGIPPGKYRNTLN